MPILSTLVSSLDICTRRGAERDDLHSLCRSVYVCTEMDIARLFTCEGGGIILRYAEYTAREGYAGFSPAAGCCAVCCV